MFLFASCCAPRRQAGASQQRSSQSPVGFECSLPVRSGIPAEGSVSEMPLQETELVNNALFMAEASSSEKKHCGRDSGREAKALAPAIVSRGSGQHTQLCSQLDMAELLQSPAGTCPAQQGSAQSVGSSTGHCRSEHPFPPQPGRGSVQLPGSAPWHSPLQ